MSGIYIHIPFCKSRCYYCDFYSCTELWAIDKYINVLKTELTDRKNYISDEVETIYFGGGTPSVLTSKQIEEIIETITDTFKVSSNAEITLEANPDDLNTRYLKELARTPVNRLSIGVQSLNSYYLKLMYRRHSEEQALQCIDHAKRFGFDNISVDIIYGIPGLTINELNSTLNKLNRANIQHLSAYHITYEKDTVFDNLKNKGLIVPISDDEGYEQYMTIVEWANANNFIHYEISNFGKLNFLSKHNSNYWDQVPYLGVGAAAHSYNVHSRRWNIDNIHEYMKYDEKGGQIYKEEQLSTIDRYNELLLTSLRTAHGIDLEKVKSQFGEDKAQLILSFAERYEKSGYMVFEKNSAILTERGFFISDRIISDMFVEK
ncbi:MAG TPA: radical SAM family heme chaperone HemW [Salinivirgaceae bacterium]|nr:radical SAM family heme chaperone HemW [Salinivirgaceae bacterium]